MKRPIDILLVEPDPVHALLIQTAISKVCHPCRVLRVVEPEEAKPHLEGNGSVHAASTKLNPELLILELLDPKKPKAASFMRWLRHQPRTKHLPAIILGVEGDPFSVAAAYDLGASSYLVKPKEEKDFIDMIMAAAVYWTTFNQPPE
jgi:CheY-like chemotaxis protein